MSDHTEPTVLAGTKTHQLWSTIDPASGRRMRKGSTMRRRGPPFARGGAARSAGSRRMPSGVRSKYQASAIVRTRPASATQKSTPTVPSGNPRSGPSTSAAWSRAHAATT